MPDQDVILNTRIQQKKDTDANWASNNPILLKNELIVVEMDSGECRFKIGDGTSSYTELPFITSGFSSVLGIDQGGTGASTTSDAASNLKVASLQPGAILPSGTDIKNVVEPNTYLLLKNFTYKSAPSDLDRSTNEILLTSKIQDTLIQHVLIAPDTVYLAFWNIPLSRAGEIESDPIPWIDLRDAKTAEALALSCTIQTDLASTSVARFNGRSNITPGITGILGVAHGGTGATTVATARANLGAAATNHTHNYAGSTSAGGVANSATKLATSRTIRTNLASTSTASFNGTENITPGVTGILPKANGGTGATSASGARSGLGVPAEIDIGGGASGFPFSYGSVVTRGGLGNTIGQSTFDNYYWGVDSNATLWGGKQTGGATSVTWKKAMMMDGSQDAVTLWQGNLTSTNSVTITNSMKFAALIVVGSPGSGEDLQVQCIPSISSGILQFCSNAHWFSYQTTVSGNNITIKIRENPGGGSFKYVYGLLKHTV